MHGGSRHGSRGQAQPKQAQPKQAPGKQAPGKQAPGKQAPGKPARSPRPAVPLPDADRLTRLLEPVVHALGLDLESVRVSAAGRRRLLRVVVDADGGVSLDTIALASRELSARLDKAIEMGELPYTLEVSSPGVDRPLTEPRHWRRAVGRLVVTPVVPAGGRIATVNHQGVTLDCDGDLREFSYAELGPGRVQIEFGHLEPGPDELDETSADEDRAEED